MVFFGKMCRCDVRFLSALLLSVISWKVGGGEAAAQAFGPLPRGFASDVFADWPQKKENYNILRAWVIVINASQGGRLCNPPNGCNPLVLDENDSAFGRSYLSTNVGYQARLLCLPSLQPPYSGSLPVTPTFPRVYLRAFFTINEESFHSQKQSAEPPIPVNPTDSDRAKAEKSIENKLRCADYFLDEVEAQLNDLDGLSAIRTSGSSTPDAVCSEYEDNLRYALANWEQASMYINAILSELAALAQMPPPGAGLPGFSPQNASLRQQRSVARGACLLRQLATMVASFGTNPNPCRLGG